MARRANRKLRDWVWNIQERPSTLLPPHPNRPSVPPASAPPQLLACRLRIWQIERTPTGDSTERRHDEIHFHPSLLARPLRLLHLFDSAAVVNRLRFSRSLIVLSAALCRMRTLSLSGKMDISGFGGGSAFVGAMFRRSFGGARGSRRAYFSSRVSRTGGEESGEEGYKIRIPGKEIAIHHRHPQARILAVMSVEKDDGCILICSSRLCLLICSSRECGNFCFSFSF